MNYVKTILSCSIASVALLTACNNLEKQKKEDMNIHHHTATGSDYSCVMHPEIKGSIGEKCPKCGMELEAVNGPDAATIDVQVTSDRKLIEAGVRTELSIAITDKDRNIPLDISHEKKMHLLIVDEKLTWFDHIHPEEQANGTYKVSEKFPAGGKYLMYVDYKPMGSAGNVYKHEIEVDGAPVVDKAASTIKLKSIVDGYSITLLNGADLISGRNQPLQISVEREGQQLHEKDIQNYLGASAHIVMIGKNDKDFLHIHPVSDKRFSLYAETQVEKPGIYRIWVQFQIGGKVRTADFTVNVTKGEKTAEDYSHHQH